MRGFFILPFYFGSRIVGHFIAADLLKFVLLRQRTGCPKRTRHGLLLLALQFN